MTARGAGRMAACVALVAFAACEGDEDPSRLPSPSPVVTEQSPASSGGGATSGCPNETAAIAGGGSRPGGTLSGDIDGEEERTESAFIVVDRAGSEGCQAFLVVETGSGTRAAPVWEVGRQGGLPQPRLHGLADLDGRPGDEILVEEAAGASTQFLGAFVLIDDSLHRLAPDQPPADGLVGPESLFPFGGSVGHLEAVDCTAEEEIVVSIATPGDTARELERGIYDIERRFFQVDGTDLEEVRTLRDSVSIARIDAFPEYRASPFGSCRRSSN